MTLRPASAWPTEIRQRALAVYVESGLAEAWRQTLVPKSTIAFWAREAGVLAAGRDMAYAKTVMATEETQVRTKNLRMVLRERMIEQVHDLIDRMDAPHVDFVGKDGRQVIHPIAPANAVKDYAISIGILIDKVRLESGEASIVTGTTDVLPEIDDHERDLLAQVLRDAIAEHEAAGAADDAGV